MSYQQKKEAVWKKGKPIFGKNPNLYRKDIFGNIIYKPAYGRHSPMGWEIDHKNPQSKGGSDHLNNLQPLQTFANRSKGNVNIQTKVNW